MENLKDLAASLAAQFRLRSRLLFRTSLFVKIILVVGGAALAGFSQFADPFFSDGKFTYWSFIGMAAAALGGIGGIFIAVTERDASRELEIAHAAVSIAKEYEEDIDAFKKVQRDTMRLIELYTSMKVMREVIEQTIGSPDKTSTDAIKLCLQTARRSLLIAFGFEIEAHWTIGVYAAEIGPDGKHQIRLIAHERSIQCDVGEGRVWPEGVGVGGVAFAKCSEVIVPDMLAPQLGTVFNLGTRTKPDDSERYRSIAAVPVMLGADAPPWGMVIATSDSSGHFDTNTDYGPQTAEALRALAGMVGLAVKVTSRAEPKGPPP